MKTVSQRVAEAIAASHKSQRRIAAESGLSQSMLSRIVAGDREPQLPELLAIGEATGFSLRQLSGDGLDERVQVAARSTGPSARQLYGQMVYLAELDSFLESFAVPES